MSLMPPLNDAWLTVEETLFVRLTSNDVTKLEPGWRQVPGGFAGTVTSTTSAPRVTFLPMGSVLEAWQVCATMPAHIEYDPEPF